MGRFIGVLVLILVLYAIVTQPLTSAAMTRSVGASLASAGTSIAQFFTAVTAGSTSTTQAASTTSTGTYTVRPGDTLGSIASAHGTTAATLAAHNGMANPNLIIPGQKVSLP
jgi:LysM repeat protein